MTHKEKQDVREGMRLEERGQAFWAERIVLAKAPGNQVLGTLGDVKRQVVIKVRAGEVGRSSWRSDPDSGLSLE